MRELGNSGARPGKTWSVVSIAAALLGAAVLCQPELAQAAPHGGGGGFHGGFGAFPRRWISRRRVHGGGFHGTFAGLHNGFAGEHQRYWHHGWHNGRYGWWSAPDWRGRTTTIRGGALIRIMTITTTASLTPAKPGTIAPIRQAITRM